MEKGLVAVDRWVKGSQAYFLTHLHADQTRNLSSRWAHGPLFCSPISARLFPAFFTGFDSSLIRVLEVGVTRSITLFSKSSGSEVRIQVIPIDANHCPGGVMYLFRGDFGSVLHTGDFRWESGNERTQLAKETLLGVLGGERVDFLYLDNTYCHPIFSFPPREAVTQQVVDFIKQHPNDEIIIAIDNLGKEDLLVHISRSLDTKIWVWPERLQKMHMLGLNDLFTSDTSLTRVRAVPRYSFSSETLDGLNVMWPTIGILPSGILWGSSVTEKDAGSVGLSESEGHSSAQTTDSRKRSADDNLKLDGNQIKPPLKYDDYLYAFPYSDHSCFSEIQEFLKVVRPKNVCDMVSSYSVDIHFCHHFDNFNCEKCTISGRETTREVRRNQNDVILPKNHKTELEVAMKKENVWHGCCNH